jgi:L-fuculose-phosphate aldolase
VLGALALDDVVVVDRDGAVLEGDHPPSSEVVMHLGILERTGVAAVVHTHPPIATALACTLTELPVIHYQQMLLGGSVRVAAYATFGSPELAELTVAALAERSAALLSGHGAVTIGPDLPTAVERSRLLEWVCGVYWRAAAVGRPRLLTDDEQSRAAASLHHGHGVTRERTA